MKQLLARLLRPGGRLPAYTPPDDVFLVHLSDGSIAPEDLQHLLPPKRRRGGRRVQRRH